MFKLNINDTFSSYKDLQSAINLFEKENRVQFWKRDAKTIASARHHAPNLYNIAKDKPEIKYYYIKYSCVHGGQEFRQKKSNPSLKNQRNHEGTYKQGCKAAITVGLSSNAELIVKNIVSEHNHEIPTEEMFKYLPKQRKLSNEDKNSAIRLLKLKVNKKLLQAHLVKQTGKAVFLKDLSNLQTCLSNTDNSIKEIIDLLMNKYNCTVDVHSEDNKLRGLFFQDDDMRKSFDLFPEVLFMDGTYKLLNIRAPVYILCVENSFGKTDVVAIGILMSETAECISWLVQK